MKWHRANGVYTRWIDYLDFRGTSFTLVTSYCSRQPDTSSFDCPDGGGISSLRLEGYRIASASFLHGLSYRAPIDAVRFPGAYNRCLASSMTSTKQKASSRRAFPPPSPLRLNQKLYQICANFLCIVLPENDQSTTSNDRVGLVMWFGARYCHCTVFLSSIVNGLKCRAIQAARQCPKTAVTVVDLASLPSR